MKEEENEEAELEEKAELDKDFAEAVVKPRRSSKGKHRKRRCKVEGEEIDNVIAQSEYTAADDKVILSLNSKTNYLGPIF